MKFKYLLLSLIVILISTGCIGPYKQYPAYIQPVDSERMSKLKVNTDDLIANYAFPLEINMHLDGQIIDDNNYPELSVNVTSGKHTLMLEITAFYHGGREKYNITKVYTIDFKPENTYMVSAKINKERLEEVTEDVEVSYTISNNDLKFEDKMVLKDSYLRTYYGGSSGYNEKVAITSGMAGMVGALIELQ